ncbi:helix-turn-helix domain-containing protein [Streptosporangium roseum]|uniref:Transcriptional regulator, XRE family n=1 Tax=Streptosporangium roseum (strain ATCC 12428 / DSM 43021 / JCM 3005 / KCTC 9067 / NCIMB 10171 / NRRL 2505 / NI 9100) TaxID=479432 RepID=D2B0F2_STRRD|nr:helix-turn-helix transcriptional regulator [Streptosporangium roseum]ACZ89158.1 putative transcriptional regulator, XRE family [Streptosporangium roseum DSM 43021]
MANLAERLGEALRHRGYSTRRAARAVTDAGVQTTHVYIHQLSKGQRTNPTLEQLTALAVLLRVPVGWLVGDDIPSPFSSGDSGQVLPDIEENPPRLVGKLDVGQRAVLGERLRLLREARGLSPAQAGDMVDVDERVVTSIENGVAETETPLDDVEALLTLYGVTARFQREAILSIARGERGPGWWDMPPIPLWVSATFGLEQRAELIRTYQLQFVPPLLQTAEYAAAAVRVSQNPFPPPDLVEGAVETTVRRQEALARESGPTLWAIVDEAALLRCIAGPQVQADQLSHLIGMSKQSHVTLQVTRLASSYLPRSAPFTMFRIPGMDPVVSVHQFNNDFVLDGPDADGYHEAFARLTVAACMPQQTADVLTEVRDRLRCLA